jgi:hypothetical protein
MIKVFKIIFYLFFCAASLLICLMIAAYFLMYAEKAPACIVIAESSKNSKNVPDNVREQLKKYATLNGFSLNKRNQFFYKKNSKVDITLDIEGEPYFQICSKNDNMFDLVSEFNEIREFIKPTLWKPPILVKRLIISNNNPNHCTHDDFSSEFDIDVPQRKIIDFLLLKNDLNECR